MDSKDSADLHRFILNGRVFHSFGAIKEKACFPYVLIWQQGCTGSSLSDERNDKLTASNFYNAAVRRKEPDKLLTTIMYISETHNTR